MTKREPNSSYFLTDIGHSHAVFTPPADIGERRKWRKWLGTGVAAITLSTAVALIWAGTSAVQPLEATVQMERLTVKMEHAKSIDPETAREVRRLISQPWYDCNQIACSAPLQARNSAVRDRLKTLIAKKTPMNNVADAKQVTPQGTDTMTTGSTNDAGPKCSGCWSGERQRW